MKWSTLIVICLLGTGLSACATTDKSSESSRREAEYHYLMGSSYLEEGKPTKALQEFILAEQLDGQRTEIHADLARVYMMKHAYDLAEKHYLKALELSDGAPEYQNNLGALYLTMERYEDAATAFRSAAENILFSNPEIAWTGLGVAHSKTGDYAAAERDYLKAISLNPGYVQPHFRLGQLYFLQDRPAEAADAFATAVKIVPDFVDGHYHLGLAQMKLRNTERARTAFEKVVRLAPDSSQGKLSINYLNILK